MTYCMNLRFRPASDTIALISKYIKQAGITRLADLTYLDDSSDLEIFSAIRPNAKSITISMGKSLQKNEAQCAALMESIETYFAEEVKPTKINVSQDDLAKNDDLFLNLNKLDYGATVLNKQNLDWCLGRTLISNKEIYIPHIALSLDSNLLLSKIFGQNSDGIASGSNYKEALIYSFLELIERNSTKSAIKTELKHVDSKIFSSVNMSKISVSFYSYDNIFNLPVIECNILNNDPLDNQSIVAGYSCHFSKHEAVIKAFIEAIQSKVGIISGARDDLDPHCYNFHKLNTLTQTQEKMRFGELCSLNISLEEQFDHIFKLLNHHKKDLAVYSYCNDDISILKTFLIDNE
jgi:ribosomal protein S12 methylthiotransferase accessory factor